MSTVPEVVKEWVVDEVGSLEPGAATSHVSRRWGRLAIVLSAFLLAIGTSINVAAQVWNGSLRLDYQTLEASQNGDGNTGILVQQYNLRMVDQLFYKNRLTLLGNFQYRTGYAGRPVEFRPRYEARVSGYGYGAQVTYEPYTLRRGTAQQEETNRRWRGSFFAQPLRWPRFSYDYQRAKQNRTEMGVSRDQWDSYNVAWQRGFGELSAGYSLQNRTSVDTIGETVEVYRLTGTTNRRLPGGGRLGVGYSFDRTWRRRLRGQSGMQNQHTATANMSGQPFRILNWSAQYSGRFIAVRERGQVKTNYRTDQLASMTTNVTPVSALRLAVTRFFELIGQRSNQDQQRTDYWQLSGSLEGALYRRTRARTTVYRIVNTGAPRGLRYNDSYFLEVRGKPYRQVDWSAELSLTDLHGLQRQRYTGNIILYMRMRPLASWQYQLGYTGTVQGMALDAFDAHEESYTSNVQFTPSPRASLSGSLTMRRNRVLRSDWDFVWAGTVGYRWPSFANISLNYNERIPAVVGTPQTPDSGSPESPRNSTFLADLLWWVTPRTTVSLHYAHNAGGTIATRQTWGLSFASQF